MTSPLHRLMNKTLQDKNTDLAIAVCKEVWGAGYSSGGLRQCDEYPFKTSYEGAATSTGASDVQPDSGDVYKWAGSSRPIAKDDNEKAGNALGLFYGQNRILDENMGTASQGTPNDPFFVSVVS
jgi:hypothetical protein